MAKTNNSKKGNDEAKNGKQENKKSTNFYKIKESYLRDYNKNIFSGKKKKIEIGDKTTFDNLIEEDTVSKTQDIKSIGEVLFEIETLNRQIISDFYSIRGNIRAFHKNIVLDNEGNPLTYKKIFSDFFGINLNKEKRNFKTSSEGQKETLEGPKNVNISYDKLYEILIALQTSNFLIFSGPSGTGKTLVAERLASYFGGEFKKLPIKSDFVDETAIFGYWNALLSKYEGEGIEILKFIYKAISNSDKPYFLLLDEMNLSRIENYFSTFLSGGEYEDSFTIIDTFVKTYEQYINIKTFLNELPYFKEDDYLLEINGEVKGSLENYDNETNFQQFTIKLKVKIPSNLKIIGTINEDETTYSLSSKVLDRAFVIMFDEAKFKDETDNFLEKIKLGENVSNILKIKPEKIKNLKFSQDLKDFFNELNEYLKGINIFSTIGYRSLELIGTYMKKYLENLNGNISLEIANLDNKTMKNLLNIVLMQKVLPKVNSYMSIGNKESYDKLINYLKEKLGENSKSVKYLEHNKIF